MEQEIYLNLETRLEWLYENKFSKITSRVVFDINFYCDVYQEDINELTVFHAKKVSLIQKKDDYFCGIQSNHFVIEIVFSEYRLGTYYLITANHKGNRRTVMIEEDTLFDFNSFK